MTFFPKRGTNLHFPSENHKNHTNIILPTLHFKNFLLGHRPFHAFIDILLRNNSTAFRQMSYLIRRKFRRQKIFGGKKFRQILPKISSLFADKYFLPTNIFPITYRVTFRFSVKSMLEAQ